MHSYARVQKLHYTIEIDHIVNFHATCKGYSCNNGYCEKLLKCFIHFYSILSISYGVQVREDDNVNFGNLSIHTVK